jgi:GDPmannose 4,6-dehydratase
MWLMLQQSDPDDYVLATGIGHTVEDVYHEAGRYVDTLPPIEIDETYKRPLEVDALIGDPSKAQRKLGWRAKTSFEEVIRELMESELAAVGT